MDLHSEIGNMFREIDNYYGNFGDPIATEFTFNPYLEIQNQDIDDKLVLGIGVAYLVNFAVCIDNNDYVSATESNHATEIKTALDKSVFSKFQHIEHSLRCALISESEFNKSLGAVYQSYIV